MTPAEKAKELVGRLKPFVNTEAGEFYDSHYDAAEEAKNAKQCALIAAEETMEVAVRAQNYEVSCYWRDVKQEIQKL